MTVAKKTVETMQFQAETERLLGIVANSVYSNKEIVLREIISNASDAIDKLRYEIKHNSKIKHDGDFTITIDYDETAKTVTISDNGIGMTKDELASNLGTIARSGTSNYLNSVQEKGGSLDSLIGQFGIGFYSSFVIADKVTVVSKSAVDTKAIATVWESEGKGEYSLADADSNTPSGTSITLHLKEKETNFTQDWYLRKIITTYSDHIDVAIKLKTVTTPSEEDKKVGKEPEISYEVVNQSKAIWTQKNLTDEQYKTFYSSLSHTVGEPLAWVHNKVEGTIDYTMLLFIPENAPFDLWNRDKVKGVRLYSQRTFIMDDAEQFLPMYLRFAKGIIDSADLPLNISREILQDSEVVNKIRSGCCKKVLKMLQDMAKNDSEKYAKFWKEFGAVIKEGPAEDYANKDIIAKLLRFSSSKSGSSEQTLSLDDYIADMAPGQDKIYYVTAESYAAALNSPHLEVFKKHNIDVLLLTDRVDEWLATHLSEYEGKNLSCVTKGSLDLPEEVQQDIKQDDEKARKEYDEIIKRVKDALGEKVKDVRVTSRLTDSPSCLVADEQEMTANLKRMLQQAGQDFADSKPIFELNPSHPLVEGLKQETQDEVFNKWCSILFSQAILAEGGHLDDPAAFVADLNSMILTVMK